MVRITSSVIGLLYLITYANSFTLKTLAEEPCETNEVKVAPETFIPEFVPVSAPIVEHVPAPNPIFSIEPTDLTIDHDVERNEIAEEILIPSLPETTLPVKTEEPVEVPFVEPSIVEHVDIVEVASVDEPAIIGKETSVLCEEVIETGIIPETPAVPEFLAPELPVPVIVDNTLPIEETNKEVDTSLVNEDLNVAEPVVLPSTPELLTFVVPVPPISPINEDHAVQLTPFSFLFSNIIETIPEHIHIDKEIFFEDEFDKVIEPLVIPPAPELPPFVLPEIPPRVFLEKEFIPHESFSQQHKDPSKICLTELSQHRLPELLSLPYYHITKTPINNQFIYVSRDHPLKTLLYPWALRKPRNN